MPPDTYVGSAPEFVPVANHEIRRCNLDKLVEQISKFPEQLACYQEASEYLEGKLTGQMIMFITGAGGCGKTKLINAISEKARICTGRTRGTTGPAGIWTPTGCAGFAVGGVTWQSALGLSQYKSDLVQDAGRLGHSHNV
jgi:hypothetical protein